MKPIRAALVSAASISAHRVVCNHQGFTRVHFKWPELNQSSTIISPSPSVILIEKHVQPSRRIGSELILGPLGPNAYNMTMPVSPPAVWSNHTPLNSAALTIPLSLQLLPLAIMWNQCGFVVCLPDSLYWFTLYIDFVAFLSVREGVIAFVFGKQQEQDVMPRGSCLCGREWEVHCVFVQFSMRSERGNMEERLSVSRCVCLCVWECVRAHIQPRLAWVCMWETQAMADCLCLWLSRWVQWCLACLLNVNSTHLTAPLCFKPTSTSVFCPCTHFFHLLCRLPVVSPSLFPGPPFCPTSTVF